MIKFLTVEQVIQIHDKFLIYGGLPGIRDEGLLISAVEMARSSFFGEDLHKSLYDKASAYLFHIVSNHPFNDGNKRTGALTAILFLEQNGIAVDFSADEYEELVIQVAQSKKNKKEIAEFMQESKNRIVL